MIWLTETFAPPDPATRRGPQAFRGRLPPGQGFGEMAKPGYFRLLPPKD